MLSKEEEKDSKRIIGLNLKPPYLDKIARKPHQVGYVVPHLQKFDESKGNTHEHVVRFLDSIGAHCNI